MTTPEPTQFPSQQTTDADQKRRAIVYVATVLDKKAETIDGEIAKLRVQMGLERSKRPAMRMLAAKRRTLEARLGHVLAAVDEVRCLLPGEEDE